MMKPTVGRRVWYWPHDYERGEGDKTQPFDAGIAHVHEDGSINISYANDIGNMMPGKQLVNLVTDRAPMPGECSWMPFKLAQAKAAADVGTVMPVSATLAGEQAGG